MSEEFISDNNNENENNIKEYGSVNISDEVVAIIASVAATEIPGGFTEMLGMKSLSKGVKVELKDNDAKIDIFIVVEYGMNISEIARNVQKNVKSSVETMTELNVIEMNVNIQGVNIPRETKGNEEQKVK